MDIINGNKTYIVAGLMIIVGLFDTLTGGVIDALQISMSPGDMITAGILTLTGRSALKKIEK